MRAGLCIGVLKADISAFFLALLLLPYRVVCITPVLKLSGPLDYFVAATVQQPSHSNFVWATTMRVWTLHMRVSSVCAMIRFRVCRCMRVCVLACWNPTFQLLVFGFALLVAAAAVVS